MSAPRSRRSRSCCSRSPLSTSSLPLVATFLFSLKSDQTGKCCSLAAYGFVIHDGQFWTTLKQSFILALETIVISLLLFVPTVYWVHLRLPRLRPVLAFLALMPFVDAADRAVVGLLDFYRGSPHWFYDEPYGFLVGAYVILAFPYMFFALDAGFRAIDVHTLTEASHSLGAGWLTTLGRVILPNIRVAALSGAFLALAIVMGEFTIASLAAFQTFPTYIQYIENTGVSCCCRVAAELRDHLGCDAGAARRRPRPPGRPSRSSRGRADGFLQLQGLRRVFGTVAALDGIDLQLEQGEFVSLLGPSRLRQDDGAAARRGFDQPTPARSSSTART